MGSGKFKVCTLIAIWLASVQQSNALITDTTCTVDAAGNTLCDGVDSNSECGTDGKCACKTDFIISIDGTKCVKKLTTIDCTTGNEQQKDAICKDVDPNSECSENNCVCKNGFKGTDICVKAPVSETSCENEDEECTVEHSECDEVKNPSICKCSHGFKEDSDDQSTCVKSPVSGTPCSGDNEECEDEHSECDGEGVDPMCKCSHGFKEDSNDGSTCVDTVITGNGCTNDDAGNINCQGVDPNAECSSGNCACKADYFPSYGGTKCVQKITTVDCTPGDANVGTSKCQNADTNSECPADGDKCTCKPGYKGTDSCVIVLTGQCTTHGDCTGTVENSECSSSTCSCVAGYKEDNNICIKAKVSEIACDANEEDCPLDNSECDDAENPPMCKCSHGFEVDSSDETSCVNIPVLEIPCKTEGCPVDNSECDDDETTPKCKCSHGYKVESDDGITCVKMPVLDIPCGSETEDCPVDNSECDEQTSPKCKCSHGYKVDSNGGITCVSIPVLEIPCGSDTEDCPVDNSECDDDDTTPKCKCFDGYEEDSSDGSSCVKSAESSATSAWMTTSVLATSVMIYLPRLICW